MATDAYWSARSSQEEHAAVQRMIALGIGGMAESVPCPAPECVALREAELIYLQVAGVTVTTEAHDIVPPDAAVPLSERGFGT